MTAVIAQAKAAMQHHMDILQSRLAKCTTERDEAKAKIQAAIDRAELAERSARDVARDRDQWRARAQQAEAALASVPPAGGAAK